MAPAIIPAIAPPEGPDEDAVWVGVAVIESVPLGVLYVSITYHDGKNSDTRA
jgi:hypothetical protein